MAASSVNPIAVGAVGAGLIFLWSGLKGASVLATVQDLIQGKKPAGTNMYPIGTPADAGTAPATANVPGGSLSNTAAQNQAIAKQLAAPYGWDQGAQWDSLVQIWNHESSWNAAAKNPSSGAYGIPQALPASKMSSAGADWQSNPATQIKWGLSYIKSRYGDPVRAWSAWQSKGWY